MGFGPGEVAEVEEARFRLLGLLAVGKPVEIAVESNVTLEGVADWERPLLAGIASELRGALVPANDNQEGDDDGLW